MKILRFATSMEDRKQAVRNYAKEHQLSGTSALLTYMAVAVQFGWDDVAKAFMSEYVREQVQLRA